MPLSSRLAPGFIRLRYSGSSQPHSQVIPINFASPPVPGVDPTLLTSSLAEVAFTDAILDYVDNVFANQFDSTTNFGFADIYAVDPTTGVRTFIYTTSIEEVGDSTGTNVALVEGVYVYKTTAGKPLKVYVMEGVYAANVRNIGSVPADGRQVMNTYILGPTNIFYGRQDAWPLAFQTFTSKVNDVLRRRSGFVDV